MIPTTNSSEAVVPEKVRFVSVVKRYAADWIVLLGLIVLDGLLQLPKPFHRFIGANDLERLRYPLKSNSVPTAVLPVIALVLPALVFLVMFVVKKEKRDLHQALLGLLYTVALTAIITDSVKSGVGWPRPDFFWRCFPDGNAVFASNGDVACMGKASVIREGRKSFPSGHSSWSYAGLGYLALYLAGKLSVFSRSGHVSKLALALLPLLGATAVAITRIDDYWHKWQDVFVGALIAVAITRIDDYWHKWQDVFVGALIGLSMAWLCYFQHYPSLRNDACASPYICQQQVWPSRPPVFPELESVETRP
eukprot:jgi/Mesen1/1349/ME000013S00842